MYYSTSLFHWQSMLTRPPTCKCIRGFMLITKFNSLGHSSLPVITVLASRNVHGLDWNSLGIEVNRINPFTTLDNVIVLCNNQYNVYTAKM